MNLATEFGEKKGERILNTIALLSNCEEINGAHQSNNLSGSSHNTHMDVRRKMEEDRNTNHP